MELAAPAKLNLCLFLGQPREDGLHDLCSVFEPLTLHDLVRLERAEDGSDQVEVEVRFPQDGADTDPPPAAATAIDGDNSVALAVAALRAAGWEGPPLKATIEKRIPVGAGLGGGSADAAAVLRLAGGWLTASGALKSGAVSEFTGSRLAQIAMRIGADVPSQLSPRFCLVEGAGERVSPLPPPGEHAFVLLTDGGGLATGKVFAEADRQRLGRSPAELRARAERLREAVSSGRSPLEYTELLGNDLEPAAFALRPELEDQLGELRRAGAAHAAMSGSGSTLFGLFDDRAAARQGAARLDRPGVIVCSAADRVRLGPGGEDR